MKDEFQTFLGRPSREKYLALRAAVIASDEYDPYSRDLDHASADVGSAEFSRARQSIMAAMPNVLLSPRAHLLLSYISAKTGDEERAQTEGAIACSCAEGILSTGDGSREHPYQIVRISDEYDVARYLRKEVAEQSLMAERGRHFDCLRCSDGSTLWFDVTDAFGVWEAQLNPSLYRVRLVQAGPNRVAVMAIIRKLWHVPLASAKAAVDAPGSVLTTVRASQLKQIRREFSQAGAGVEFDGPLKPGTRE